MTKKNIGFLTLMMTLVLSLTACQSDENELFSEGGFIRLALSTDDAVVTRAVQNAEASDWYAVINNGSEDVFNGLLGSTLVTTRFAVGTYSVAVSNYAHADEALAANDGWGAPYYEGTQSGIGVASGETSLVTIACGKTKFSKVKLDCTKFPGTIHSVSITSPRTLVFSETEGTLDKEAYFTAHAQLTYTVNFTLNDETKTTEARTLTMGGAATQNTLVFRVNIDGSIGVSLTLDDEYASSDNRDLDIDAAAGK